MPYCSERNSPCEKVINRSNSALQPTAWRTDRLSLHSESESGNNLNERRIILAEIYCGFFQVCETESKVLETATFRRLTHSLFSGTTSKPVQTRLHTEKPHFTITIRLTNEHPITEPFRSPLSNPESRTDLISLIRNDKNVYLPTKRPHLFCGPYSPLSKGYRRHLPPG